MKPLNGTLIRKIGARPRRRLFGSIILGFLLLVGLKAAPRDDSFDLLVYNVENLFDADGIALFNDYREFEKEGEVVYSPLKLLTKLKNIARVLETFNAGEGPEIILFNELEFDRTSGKTAPPYEVWKRAYAGTSVSDLLTTQLTAEVRNLPVEFFLWKFFKEQGFGDYYFTIQSPRLIDATVEAHTNAVFSKYPISQVLSHPTEEARDILEVTLDVEGETLILFANHWKSGASRLETEPLRVQNARVLRKRLDTIFQSNPWTDVIVAGDLNSNYNQNFVHPGEITGIIDILGSQGDELAIRDPEHSGLYNLWFELPPQERFSEVYRNRYNTLMHILLSRGLYDYQGVQYVDGSFQKVILPGENARPPSMRPIRWYFLGDGGGFSDHLPIAAEFRVLSQEKEGLLSLKKPSRTPLGSSEFFSPVRDSEADVSSVEELEGLSDNALASRYGDRFLVRGPVLSQDPLFIQAAGRAFQLYVPDRELFLALQSESRGEVIQVEGRLGEYRGQIQFIVESRD